MSEVSGARQFQVGAEAYDRMMGRYSTVLAQNLCDVAGIEPGQRVLDVGCGPGGLTSELVRRLGAEHVCAVDPSPTFLEECKRRNAGVDVRQGAAEALPFDDGQFDVVLSQLVLNFVSDPPQVAAEFKRVLAPGGTATSCVWDLTGGMQALRTFWTGVQAIGLRPPAGPDRSQLGSEGEIAELLRAGGFADIEAGEIESHSEYADIDDYWSSFAGGAGPAGSFFASLTDEQRLQLRGALAEQVGHESTPFTLRARAWYGKGRA